MPISQKALGKRLKEARLKRGLTQEQVAQAINISTAHLSKIERGLKPIGLKHLAALCDVLDIPIAWAVAGVNIPQNSEYNRMFGEIVKVCSPDMVEALLLMCKQIAQMEKKFGKDRKKDD